ncbi:hypothetical protein F5883DRAFT_578622 [Diaporthe sp. PMI_573]|nr:hypothetical protein F5883DRAFT_578622 [Diaporthaceae sp. PMI_573]
MKKSRGFTNPAKGFINRRKGVMKKANMLSKLTGAHMAVLCEFNGEIYIYQSDDHFSPILNSVRARQRFGPDHFDTVAERATGVSHHRAVAPGDKRIVPTLSFTSSPTSHADEDLPLITLGSPLYSGDGQPSDLAVAIRSAAAVRHRQPCPLAVDFFGAAS